MPQHTARHPARSPQATGTPLRRLGSVLAALALVVAAGLAIVVLRGGEPAPAASEAGTAAGTLPAGGSGALPVSSTYAEIDGAPTDPDPAGVTDGVVVHPVRETPVHDRPGGVGFAVVAPTQFGDAWFPVVKEGGGWVRILLPSRPNGSSGWVRAADVERAVTPYRVVVHLGSRTLELVRDGERVGSWPVAVGAAGTPTPTGRTFVLGAFRDPGQDFSPVILPLGAHSPSFDSYGSGPGTVAIHGWPDAGVFGTAVSDGCVRVPSDALEQLSRVPLGTLVMIDQD